MILLTGISYDSLSTTSCSDPLRDAIKLDPPKQHEQPRTQNRGNKPPEAGNPEKSQTNCQGNQTRPPLLSLNILQGQPPVIFLFQPVIPCFYIIASNPPTKGRKNNYDSCDSNDLPTKQNT